MPVTGSEAFPHYLLALGPERLGVLRIKGVGPDPGAHRTDRPIGDLRYVAVLAVAAADLFGRGDEGGPDRGRGSLGDRLDLEGRPPFGSMLGGDPLPGRVELRATCRLRLP